MNSMLSRAALTIVAMAVTACGAQSGTGAAPTPDRVLATSDAGTIRDQDHITNPSVVVQASPDSVFRLLPQVFHELGVDIKYSNPLAKRIGNREFTKYYKLGNAALHEYVGCGTTMTGLSADSYRIQMSLLSTVSADGAGSKVETELSARADDPGSSKGWMSCSSTGVLETRINTLLARKVKG